MPRRKRTKNTNPLPRGQDTQYPMHISVRVSENTYREMERMRGGTHMSRWVRGMLEYITKTGNDE